MRDVRWMLTLCALLSTLPALCAGEVDLTQIDRTIRTEPEYQSESPRYGLLVLGPRATTPVWIVLDGERLYVDGNADGSDDGEPQDAAAAGPAEGNISTGEKQATVLLGCNTASS